MQKRWANTLFLLTVLTVTASAAGGPGQVVSGQALFNAVGCWACHGYGGQGTLTGPQIAPSILPLSVFQQLLRHPARGMPAYSAAVLSDAQVANIYTYLNSLVAPKRAQDISPLNH
jgi:ubiquinol-cytochrome c reductase cytochrome c subunit